MTAKEYYKSTRMVETRNWTLEMALNFAEEYAEALRKHAVSGRSGQLKAIEELIDLAQDCCPAERIDYLHNIINRL